MDTLEREAVKLTAMLAATEQWAPVYSKTPEQHANLINAEAEMQLIMVRFFKNMQKKAGDFINWDHYNYQVQLDYNVEVIVNEQQIEENDGAFIKVTLHTVNKMVAAGMLASEVLSPVALGIPSTSALIQKLGVKQVAALVGRKVLADGTIVKNPNTSLNILGTVRKDIAQSVKTSLGLGETTDEAIARIQTIINPVERAELIAQTESVNAYQAGVTQFGNLSGAVGMQWQDAGATDICLANTAAGVIPIGSTFPGGVTQPTQHPRCRCGRCLIYQDEWDAIQSGHPYEVNDGITPKPANYVPWKDR